MQSLLSVVRYKSTDEILETLNTPSSIDALIKNNVLFSRCIHAAARHGDLQVCRFMLDTVNPLDPPVTSDGSTLLHSAAVSGNIELIDYFIGKSVHPAMRNDKLRTMFHVAARYGHSHVFIAFRNMNTDNSLNCKDYNGDTPLHTTVMYSRFATCSVLLSQGVNSMLKNNEGLTAFGVAMTNDDNYMATLLLSNAREYERSILRNELIYECTPLRLSVIRRNTDMVLFLVRHGALIENDSVATTSLHIAVQRGYLDIVSILLKEVWSGVTECITKKDDQGLSPLDYAKLRNDSEMIDIFNEYVQ